MVFLESRKRGSLKDDSSVRNVLYHRIDELVESHDIGCAVFVDQANAVGIVLIDSGVVSRNIDLECIGRPGRLRL